YCPVVPLLTEERVSALVVNRRVLAPPKVWTPVPPCPTETVPVEVKFLDPSVKTTFPAVRPERFTVPEDVSPVNPVRVPVAVIFPLLATVKTVFPLADAVKTSPVLVCLFTISPACPPAFG